MLIIRLCTSSIVALFFVASITGCVNLETVEKFAKGTQALSEASGKFYEMELETDRQLAAMTVDLGTVEGSDEYKAKCGNMTPWDCATKGKNIMSEVRRNRAAVAALAQYAQSLNEIATFNDDKNIEKAAKDLSSNLSSLGKTLDSAANPNEEALANAISQLGKIYIDIKVRKIIYEKIKLAQNDVETIINMLKDDIKRQQDRFRINRINNRATREEWFKAFRSKYQSNVNSNVNFDENAILSITAGNLIADDLKEELAIPSAILFLEKLNKAADSCIKTHAAIQNQKLSDKAGTLVKFISDARSLLSSVNQLRN